MSINSRTKGKVGENEIANLLFKETGVKLIRNLDQVRAGGHDLIVDYDQSNADEEICHFFNKTAIEVKRYKTATDAVINTWWEQTLKQSLNIEALPVLIYRLNHQQWRVVLPVWFLLHDKMAGLSFRTFENSKIDKTCTMSLSS